MTPFSLVLEQEKTRLQKLRRALRAEDRAHFDELFEHARLNIQAAVQASAPDAMESVILLILVEMQKQIDALKLRVSELEGKERFRLVAPNENHED